MTAGTYPAIRSNRSVFLVPARERQRLARWLAPDLLFNSDMSREIDRLIAENDRLRKRIRELEGGSV